MDSHCHIDLYPDPAGVITEISERGIEVIAVTNAPSVFDSCRVLVSGCPSIRPAVGLHPQLAQSHAHENDLLLEYLQTTRFVGEVGLDHSTNDLGLRQAQRGVFESVLQRCADIGQRVLSVHSRRAAGEVLKMIEHGFPGTIILHWFSGTLGELERAHGIGAFFSVNPAMIGSQKGQKLISRMNPDRVLTETDGPFVSVDRRSVSPGDASRVTAHLARVWGCHTGEARERILANFNGALAPCTYHKERRP